MRLHSRILGIVWGALVSFFWTLPVYAGGLLDASSELQKAGMPVVGAEAAGKDPADLTLFVGKIIQMFLTVVGGLLLLLLIYGGYLWMIARGDAEKAKKAKEVIVDAVIGIVIIFAAYAITRFVVDRIVSAAVT